MSNLLNDAEGRAAILTAQRFLLQRRLSRFFKRNLVIDYDQWSHGGEFDLGTLLGALNDHWDDEIRDLYRLLGHVGGLADSVADDLIYVNASLGSDIEGTGSAAEPYASLWFLPHLPRRIGHHYSILIKSNIDHDDMLTVCQEFTGDGCLSFVGQGVAVDPYAGGLDGTVSAHTTELNTWMFVTTSVNPVVANMKQFIRMTSGGSQDNAAPICTCDPGGSRLWARFGPLAGIANGDGYSYALPPWTIRVEGGSITALNGQNATRISSNPAVSRVNFVNLNIDVDSEAPTRYRSFVTDGAPMGFWFCRILCPDNSFSAGPDIVFKNDINKYNPATSTSDLVTESQSDIANIFLSAGGPASAGLAVVNRSDTDPRHEWDDAVIGLENNARVQCVDAMGRWEVLKANVELRQCSARSFLCQNTTAWFYNCAAIAEITGVASYCLYANLSRVNWIEGLWGTSDTCGLLQSGFLRFINSGADSGALSTLSYGVDLSGISKMYMTNAWQGTAPPAGQDIYWSDQAVPSSVAFPPADTIETDSTVINGGAVLAAQNVVMRT
jgi:hypothetical protein